MLIKISFLSFLSFGVLYPLCFWISSQDPIKNNFLRFHLGCPVFLAGLAITASGFIPIDPHLQLWAWIWLIMAMSVTAYLWDKQTVHLGLISLLCLWGVKLYSSFYFLLVGPSFTGLFVNLLSGLILAGAFYAMNLGHFYLNVYSLKLDHLRKALAVLCTLLFIRLIWDIYALIRFDIFYDGETLPLRYFLFQSDGILVNIAVLFGVIFPLVSLWFAWGTLKLKNTQATTGILYVTLSSLLLGDLAYKYYLIKHNIFL